MKENTLQNNRYYLLGQSSWNRSPTTESYEKGENTSNEHGKPPEASAMNTDTTSPPKKASYATIASRKPQRKPYTKSPAQKPLPSKNIQL